MATDKKISDLDPIPGSARPADEDLLITAREDSTNFKIPFSGFAQHSAERVNSAFTTGDQTINGVKTFSSFIMGNISGKLSGVARYAQDGVYTTGDQTIGGVKTFSNFIFSNVSGNLSGIARHVQDGVYTTGNQTIDGVKTFSDFISGNVSGNLSGTARYVEHGVYTTGDQTIAGEKTFSNFIKGNVSGNLSGTARYVQDGVYTTGDQTINGVKTFSSFISGNLSGTAIYAKYVQSGVYTSGDQNIYGTKDFKGELLLSGSPVLTEDNFGGSIKDVVYLTGNQFLSGDKTFYEYIKPSGGIVASNEEPIVITDGGNPNSYKFSKKSLSLAFESGVFITGGAAGGKSDLHVEGTVFADRINSLEDIVGESGAMVFTDGRDPALFEGPDKSLSMAFQSGVFITGGAGGEKANLHVEGTVFADRIDSLEDIVGESGAMVFTDGRDPALFEGPDKSLAMAFQSGVFITGGVGGEKANLHVEGTVFADRIDSLEDIVGESGAMVFTDGRDPALFEGPDKSLSMAFQSGVFITGGVGGEKANLHVEGTVFADRIDSLEDIVGESGAMVFTDGRDPALFEGPDKSLSMAFQSGVFITGGVGGEKANLHVEGTVFADRIDSLEDIIGESGAMVFTDGRDPALFEGPDKSLSMAFQSGVFITGEAGETADLFVQGSGIFYGGVRINGDLEVDSLNVASIVSHDYIYSHFTQDTNGNQDFFIPLHAGEGVINESNTPFASRGHTLVTPYKGRINKIMLRARGGSKNPGNTTFTVCTGHNPIIGGSSHVFNEEAVTIAGVDRASTYSFNFTNPLHFNQGSVILIKGKCAQSTSSLWTVTAEINYTID